MFLTDLLYIIIWLFSCIFFVRIIQKPELIYTYPYMMSFGFAVFILPQVYVIYVKETFRTDSMNRLFLMTILCWVMAVVGWYKYQPKSHIFQKAFLKPYNEERLGLVGIIFVCTGILFNFLAFQIFKTESFENQQATGIVTIFVFFQQLLFLGTGLCLGLVLKNRKTIILVFTLIGFAYCFYIGILQGRRTQTLYTLFILGIPLFIKYNTKPSRLIVIAALVGTFIFIPSTDQYRRILKSSETMPEFFKRVTSEVNYTQNMKDSYLNSKSLELINAGYEIKYVYESGEYMMGISYWNEIVARFIPAQIVGKEFKESLFLERSPFAESYIIRGNVSNPNYIVGTTVTGVGDSFAQFDYFGCLLFLLFAIIMKRIWVTLKETKNPIVQVFYSLILVECLISLTHGTSWFLPGFIATYMFLYLASLIARA